MDAGGSPPRDGGEFDGGAFDGSIDGCEHADTQPMDDLDFDSQENLEEVSRRMDFDAVSQEAASPAQHAEPAATPAPTTPASTAPPERLSPTPQPERVPPAPAPPAPPVQRCTARVGTRLIGGMQRLPHRGTALLMLLTSVLTSLDAKVVTEHSKRMLFNITSENASSDIHHIVKITASFDIWPLTMPWFKVIETWLERLNQTSSPRDMQAAEHALRPLSKSLMELMVLRRTTGTVGFPPVITARVGGRCNSAYIYIKMAQLGPSLEELLCLQTHDSTQQRRMTAASTALLAHQMLERIEHLHVAAGVIHGDIQPSNWAVGRGRDANVVHCIDFHTSKAYPRLDEPRECPLRHSLGERHPKYVSIGWLRGGHMTRRDDLESIAYILMEAHSGSQLSFPSEMKWTKSDRAPAQRLADQKESTPFETFCPDCPVELAVFLNLTRSLGCHEHPDYAGYRKLFEGLFERSTSTCSSSPGGPSRRCKSAKLQDAKFDWQNNPGEWSPCAGDSQKVVHTDAKGLSSAISNITRCSKGGNGM